MKKIFWIFFGLAILLSGIIFVLYRNKLEEKEEMEIFKEDDEKVENSSDKSDDLKAPDLSEVTVDIKGMVVNPGVYKVSQGSRVNDVINLAGGLLEGADTSLINLAKIVKDEMAIIIYSKEEVLEKYKEEICVCECPEINNDACIDDSSSDELVNINTASLEMLMEIPGIGEAKAKEIITYREKNGLFKNISDIKNVEGIGEALFEKIKDYITV